VLTTATGQSVDAIIAGRGGFNMGRCRCWTGSA